MHKIADPADYDPNHKGFRYWAPKVYEQMMRLNTTIQVSAHHHTSGTVRGIIWIITMRQTKLVLLHGFSASHTVWLRCARHLTRDFHILILICQVMASQIMTKY